MLLGWILNLVYAALLLAVSPWLVWRAVREGKYRDGWGAKFLGRLPKFEAGVPRLWFHAVSVGEVIQLEPVLRQLRLQCPDHEFVLSTTTRTGFDVAVRRYPELRVVYFPLDFTWSVAEALRRVAPSAVVLVELELWPNFLREAERRHIPVLLINGRVSERSFRGYLKIRPVLSRLLRRFALVVAQTETYRDRLVALGAASEVVHVTGSIKFDRVETDRGNRRTQELREYFGIGATEPVFIAGSTQEPEERFAVASYLAARQEFPGLRLILVPRHKERFDEVARLVAENYKLPLLRRSTGVPSPAPSPAELSSRREASSDDASSGEPSPVLLLDTLGELSACWGLADVAFVGGSLTRRGGQNMIEPAGFGAVVLFGPNTSNFKDVVEHLLAANAATVVRDADELTARLLAALRQPEPAREQGARAQQFVASQRGATARTVELMVRALEQHRRRAQKASRFAA